MASTINALTSGGGLAVSGDTSGSLQLQTNNGTTAMTIDTSQKVGIGTTSPATKLHVSSGNSTNFAVNGSTKGVRFDFDSTQTSIVGVDNTFFATYQPLFIGASYLAFGVGITEKMRLDSSGNLLIGGTTARGQLTAESVRPWWIEAGSGAVHQQANAGGWQLGYYFHGSSGTNRGGFGVAGSNDTLSYYWVGQTGSGTGVQLAYGGNSWAALSDIREKNILGEVENALDKVNKIRPVYYKYKTDEESQSRRVGFIAQEVKDVLPEAVNEFQMDEENPSEETKRLSLSYTDTIPLLLKAIQELNAKVTALESQLGAK